MIIIKNTNQPSIVCTNDAQLEDVVSKKLHVQATDMDRFIDTFCSNTHVRAHTRTHAHTANEQNQVYTTHVLY